MNGMQKTTNNSMKNWITILLLTITSLVIGQEPLITWGKPLTNENVEAKIKRIIRTDENGFYALRETNSFLNKKCWIEKFDLEYNQVFSKEFDVNEGVMGKSLTYRFMLPSKEKFLLFYDNWDKSQMKASLMVRKINLDGELEKEQVELEMMTAQKQINSGNYHAVMSPDKTKLLVLSEFPFEKGSMEKIRLSVFDALTLKKLWTKDITLNNESKRTLNNEILVDNKGNAFMLKLIDAEKQRFDHVLFTMNAATLTWKANTIFQDERLFISHLFKMDVQGNVVCAGFYSTKNERKLEGTFYIRCEGDLTAAATAYEPFGAIFLSQHMSAKKAAEPNAHIEEQILKDLLFLNDGTAILIAENSYVSTTSYPSSSGPSAKPITKYSYHYKDALLFALEKSGKKRWANTIQKAQSEIELDENHNQFGSFVYGLVSDRIFILWNNTRLTPNSIPPQSWTEKDGKEYYKNASFGEKTHHATFMYVVESDGKVTYQDKKFGLPLFSMHKNSIFRMSMYPSVFQTVEDGIILMSEMNNNEGKRYKFGKINL